MTIFAIILGILYALTGLAKLSGKEDLAAQFDEFGLGRSGMLAVGVLEVAAGIGLQIDSLRTWAAVGMIAMMVGALLHHAKAKHPINASIPAFVFLALSCAFAAFSL